MSKVRALTRKVCSKIQGRQGETITEVLVAIVISTLSILMLATAVASAVNMNRNSQEAMDSYYRAVSALAVPTGGSLELSLEYGESGDSVSLDSTKKLVHYHEEQVDGTTIVSFGA